MKGSNLPYVEQYDERHRTRYCAIVENIFNWRNTPATVA